MRYPNARDHFGAREHFDTGSGEAILYRIDKLADVGLGDSSMLPKTIKILLEAALRNCDDISIMADDIEKIARWSPSTAGKVEIPFRPSRVILQDFTGVPSLVDLAALRSAFARKGGDPERVNPVVPVNLVIDHSVQVDVYNSPQALIKNSEIEFSRNRERYEFLRWGAENLRNFSVVPPAVGIVHQVNLEYLASLISISKDHMDQSSNLCYPDSMVGTDSHTTMINGLGILGWGVGGIEAEAVMLGEPVTLVLPPVVGVFLSGELREGATATDLVLTITRVLREHGVVGKFVEFFGPGISSLSLPDRATISNMAPEYGATVGYFPIDEETIAYIKVTGRSEELTTLVERYAKIQGLFFDHHSPVPDFSEVVKFDLGEVEPCLAGPVRPQDRIPLSKMKSQFWIDMFHKFEKTDAKPVVTGESGLPAHGSVVIAAITSCTNTSNPGVMLAAGLLAKRAVELGLGKKEYVKTSLAPGSKVVSQYLERAGLMKPLEALGFHVVGYGCTTCIGNSGPLPENITRTIEVENLVVASVLSGNRNFEGRINPHTRANYLASPPLVVAYALAGRVDIDFETEPIGYDTNRQAVFLRDLWPGSGEVEALVQTVLNPELFINEYETVYTSNETWNSVEVPEGKLFSWDPESTYIREPLFFSEVGSHRETIQPIRRARVLLKLADSITTDHISPAGAIAKDSPASIYLEDHGVVFKDYNSYGSRRGNHEVMIRGTFANVRIRNEMLNGVEGGYTRYIPSKKILSTYDAAIRYIADGTPLLVIAGKDYGSGSSRDWAAKGTRLLGIRAVIAESFERIHRSNLVQFGVLPLEFEPGEDRDSLELTGEEQYDIDGLTDDITPSNKLLVEATAPGGNKITFQVTARLDTPVDVVYYKNGGVLHTVLRRWLKQS